MIPDLTGVTFTGADNSIEPIALANISERYPEVEWGILFSPKHQYSPRFPSDGWIKRLLNYDLKLSAHLCGGWVRNLVDEGRFSWADRYGDSRFGRVQLNFHAEPIQFYGLFNLLEADEIAIPIILQCDGAHDETIKKLWTEYTDICPLFDTSGGAGILPNRWPQAWKDTTCGYAGGLGPENVASELDKIRLAAGDQPFWIDMERRVRSADDLTFDLDKVRAVLKQVYPGRA